MKKVTMICIVAILIILVGLFMISPFSPLNKVSVDGHGIDLPDGYRVANSSETGVTITNNTTSLSIYSTNEETTDLANDVNEYKNKYIEDFNVSSKKFNTTNSQVVYKTVAKPENKTVTIYWFTKDDKIYKIRSENAAKDTDDVALKLISSMN